MKNRILKIILIILTTFLIIILYGVFVETKSFKTNEIKVISSISDNFNGLKIIQISDIHYKTTVDKEMLTNIIKEINLIKPDIVILTGDLFNKNVDYTDEDYENIKELFKKIDTNFGKYAIKGDNDSNDMWENVINESDFIDLNDTYNLIFNNGNIPIIISGISSNSAYREIAAKIENIEEYIESLDVKPNYSILIMHEPDYVDNINVNNYNLILAGHSLGGISIPGIGRVNLPDGAKKYSYGHYKINNTDLYVSNGLGTDNIKFRFFNKPSINFYRITK